MPKQDDSDIKIFNTTKKSFDYTDELLEAADLLRKQRANGNIKKAGDLGLELAQLKPSDISLEGLPAELEVDKDFMSEIRTLLVYVAQTVLHTQLSEQQLSSCALNSLYDMLSESEPDFYDKLCEGVAFSLYALALKQKNPALSIGESFAGLCSSDAGKDFLVKFGADFYEKSVLKIKSIIDGYKFIGID